jgi:NAD(P)-dependent dehydrogenase (short-subunit alcohol dehydrogenase family)
MRLANKTALITGGTTGIGFATAVAFLREGAKVAITGQNDVRIAAAKKRLGKGVLAIKADAASLVDTFEVAAKLEREFGKLDILFLNAGIAKRASLPEVTEEKFDEMFGINVKGVLFPVKQMERLLPSGASIIVTTSINNQFGMDKTHLYSASKAASRSLVRTLANELSERHIRVNAISPGPTFTSIGEKLELSEEEVMSLMEKSLSKIPLNRIGTSDELAEAVLFLASESSSYITGQEIVVDGGWTGVML